jgi:hypothetical protein
MADRETATRVEYAHNSINLHINRQKAKKKNIETEQSVPQKLRK